MNERTRGTVEMTAAMAISGTIGWLVVSSEQPVINVVFYRCLFGTAALVAICAALGYLRRDLLPPRVLLVAVLGGVAIVLNWVLLFAAFSRASISIATAVYNTQPLMLVGLGALIFRERITATTLAWLALAFAGMLAIVQVEPTALVVSGGYLAGIGLALGAAFLYALAAIAAKYLKGSPPHLIALVQVVVGTIMLAPFADFAASPVTAAGWANLATIGVVHTGIMYVLLYGALQKLPTALAGGLSFFYPAVAIAVDHVAFGQRLEPLQIAGAVAVLVAAAGINQRWRLPVRRGRRPAGGTVAR